MPENLKKVPINGTEIRQKILVDRQKILVDRQKILVDRQKTLVDRELNPLS